MTPPPEASPVVIGGTGGSGTRVVARLLQDAGWFMGTALNPMLDALELARFDYHWGPGFVAGRTEPGMEAAFDDALRRHLGEHDPSCGPWGWKHPHSYLLIPFLAERFAGLRFVHVIRDGRDMALSGNRMQLRLYAPPEVRGETGGPAVKAMRFWAWSNERAADDGARLGDRYLQLRLEDLCADPEGAAARLFAFAGDVPADVDRLAASAVSTPESLGRWRKMSGDLLARLEEASGSALDRFGYARGPAGPVAGPPPRTAARLGFAAFGVTIELTLDDPRLETRVLALLPPGWVPARTGDPDVRLRLTSDLDVVAGDEVVAPAGGVGALDAAIRNRIGRLAPGRIFVHAGVVAHDGAAIVLPGRTNTGKTTLVSALVAAGAQYCSDEFAVLDADGLVHPYPRPLGIRPTRGAEPTDVPVDALGGIAATAAFPIGLIACTRYERGAVWQPEQLSPGQGAMELLANAVPARDRAAETLAIVRRAAAAATILSGPRGEAEAAARQLLEQLAGIFVTPATSAGRLPRHERTPPPGP